MNEEKQPIGVVGVGWVGLVTATCFAELGHDVVALDIDQKKIETLRRGEITIHEPGLGELLTKTPSGSTSRRRWTTCSPAAHLLFCCVDTPPDLLGRRRPLAGPRGGRQAPGGRPARAGDEEHRAVGDGRRDQPRQAGPRLRLLPRVPQGGHGDRRLHAPGPRRDRRRTRLRVGRRGRRAPLRAARRRAGPHRRRFAPR